MNINIVYSVISIIIAYLLGSIPVSYISGIVLKKIDIRKHGSGNVGATNALRVLGWRIGLVVMILDIFKGFLAIQIGRYFFRMTDLDNQSLYLIFVGMSAILGHIFTIFLKFKGGKGVATSTGVFMALTPIPFGIAFLSFVIIVSVTKYVSLGSICASFLLFVSELIVNLLDSFNDLENLILTAVIAAFIIIKHKSNIRRLIAGNENKINFKKK